jgi:hypothetical protein
LQYDIEDMLIIVASSNMSSFAIIISIDSIKNLIVAWSVIIAIPSQLYLASLQWLNVVFIRFLAIQCTLACCNTMQSLLAPLQYDVKIVPPSLAHCNTT